VKPAFHRSLTDHTEKIMTSIVGRFLPSSYSSPSPKQPQTDSAKTNPAPKKDSQDPIGDLKKYAASLTNQHKGGLFRALANSSGSQAVASPNASAKKALQLPDVASLDRDDAARLLNQVDKMLDKQQDTRLAFKGSNGKEQTESLSTYRNWLQAKGGINTYA
jgi:hypothetical protein